MKSVIESLVILRLELNDNGTVKVFQKPFSFVDTQLMFICPSSCKIGKLASAKVDAFILRQGNFFTPNESVDNAFTGAQHFLVQTTHHKRKAYCTKKKRSGQYSSFFQLNHIYSISLCRDIITLHVKSLLSCILPPFEYSVNRSIMWKTRL